MTKAQEKMVERIRKEAQDWIGSDDQREFKTFEVSDCGAFISVYIVIGTQGDEGTLAECFCRDRVHVFIGPRGGTKCPVYKRFKNGKFHSYYIPYSNFLSVSIRQG